MFPSDTNILIVDDMMTMRKLVKKALNGIGLTKITEAENGKTAFTKFQDALKTNTPFQLVISDWNMPEMTGIQLLRQVRQSHPKLPFVLLTAESEKSQVIEALQAKVSGYVIKPFTPQQLADKLKSVYTAVNPPAKAA